MRAGKRSTSGTIRSGSPARGPTARRRSGSRLRLAWGHSGSENHGRRFRTQMTDGTADAQLKSLCLKSGAVLVLFLICLLAATWRVVSDWTAGIGCLVVQVAAWIIPAIVLWDRWSELVDEREKSGCGPDDPVERWFSGTGRPFALHFGCVKRFLEVCWVIPTASHPLQASALLLAAWWFHHRWSKGRSLNAQWALRLLWAPLLLGCLVGLPIRALKGFLG